MNLWDIIKYPIFTHDKIFIAEFCRIKLATEKNLRRSPTRKTCMVAHYTITYELNLEFEQ
ncbi:hypothetical protein BpHYR1_011992 [Brachionus plicatilis]|uniref:Uncharacterized protein n=1 Tax=Brachionus plicatilis TaxID=10195 RepID=A0A3M7RZN7_BRAPC|nr:hypothetical protein BpHYR1_011992 [Brachionus plicatilis]